MKLAKFGVLMTVLTLLFGSTIGGAGQVFAQQQFIRGDADGDCLVGALDLYFLICYKYSFPPGPPPPCRDAADVNDNGLIELADIVGLMNYFFIPGSPPPSPPFPEPGLDPTPDDLDCANACVAPTPSNLDSLIVPSASGFAGDTITIPIIVRNSQALSAYQIHLEFNPNILEVIDVDTTGTATGTVGPASPSHFGSWIDNITGRVDISCTFDCAYLGGIPIGRDTLIKIICQAKLGAPCGPTMLDLKNVMGPPFWGNLTYAGGKVYPTLVDGTFWVTRVPDILSVTDVGNDEGRQVRLNWARCCYDTSGSPVTITEYSIWRRIGEDKANVQSKEILVSDLEMFDGGRVYPPGEWDFIKTVPARGEEEYNTVCPTLGDSTQAGGMYWSVFFVSAMTSDPSVYFDSDPDSGYSLDNIPPLPIRDLEVNPNSWFTLKWTVPGEYEGEHPISTYDIRYNTVPVGADTQAWWNSATACAGEGFFNFIVGEEDSIRVAEESRNHPEVYFAIKGLDSRPNASGISNIVRFKCGDADGDGVVNVTDVVYLINYKFLVPPGPPPKPWAAGDVDCNGVINVSDVVYLINFLYLIPPGPPPCGS
jgi:hypothetical protein